MIYKLVDYEGKEHLVVPVEVLKEQLQALKDKMPGSNLDERKLVVYKRSQIHTAIDEVFKELEVVT